MCNHGDSHGNEDQNQCVTVVIPMATRTLNQCVTMVITSATHEDLNQCVTMATPSTRGPEPVCNHGDSLRKRT